MKSEVIYKVSSSWFGRWGDDEGYEITIAAAFDDPSAWPFTVTRRRFYDDEETFCKTYKISKDLFYKIKGIIAAQTYLADCPSEIENQGRDLTDDSYLFSCNEYTKQIYGASIESFGSYEADGNPDDRTANYFVYVTVKEIENAIKDAGVDIYAD